MKQMSFFGYDAAGYSKATGYRQVYFVKSGAYVKIGFTTQDIRSRLKDLSTGNPDNLELIGTIIVRDDQDDRHLHDRFVSYHHRGEWFDWTPELKAEIEDLIAIQHPERRPVVTMHIERKWAGQEIVFTPTCPRCGSWFGFCVRCPPDLTPDSLIASGTVTCGHKHEIVNGEDITLRPCGCRFTLRLLAQ